WRAVPTPSPSPAPGSLTRPAVAVGSPVPGREQTVSSARGVSYEHRSG
ncbi:MAG: hypothetical protein AVDCRST_MAG33-2402, partial [uncultured Thermomicrobiales bacterium]